MTTKAKNKSREASSGPKMSQTVGAKDRKQIDAKCFLVFYDPKIDPWVPIWHSAGVTSGFKSIEKPGRPCLIISACTHGHFLSGRKSQKCYRNTKINKFQSESVEDHKKKTKPGPKFDEGQRKIVNGNLGQKIYRCSKKRESGQKSHKFDWKRKHQRISKPIHGNR